MRPCVRGIRLACAILAVGTILAFGAARGANPLDTDVRPWRAQAFPHFYVDATYFSDPGAEGTLELYYEISYSQLQFLREGGGFRADFEIQAILYDPKGKQVTGDSWTRRVTCSSYEQTESPESSYTETLRLRPAPGKYDLVVRTENVEAGRQSSVSVRLDLKPIVSLPAISNVLIGVCGRAREDSVGGGSLRAAITPHPRARFGERNSSMCVYAEIYDSPAAESGFRDTSAYRVLCRIVDERGAIRLSDTVYVARSGRTSYLLYSPSLDSLNMGRYTLELALGRGPKAAKAVGTFEIDESRFPLDVNIDDTMALLSYIAPRSELEPLKKAAGAERKRLWMEFWAKRDPNPETPENEFLAEFFDRVRYANDNFSYFGPGWKTDRGRIYIRRGPPDSIESRPVNASGPAYEVWYYYELNLTFVFVDRTGLGDYQLIGPSYE